MPEPHRVRGFDWVRAHWDELPQDVWIAVTSRGIAARAETCPELRRQIPDFLWTDDPPVIVLRHDGKRLLGSREG